MNQLVIQDVTLGTAGIHPISGADDSSITGGQFIANEAIIQQNPNTEQVESHIVYKYIDAISKTGVDAIKFQTHIAEEESTLDEPFRKNFNFKIKNRFDYWKSVEFSIEQWKSIKKYSEKKGLIFLTSVFSIKAAKMMKTIGIKALKLGSGEFYSFDLLDEIIKLRLPILLSTGVATYKEINNVYIPFFENYNSNLIGE